MIASLNDRKGVCMSEGQGVNEGSEPLVWILIFFLLFIYLYKFLPWLGILYSITFSILLFSSERIHLNGL